MKLHTNCRLTHSVGTQFPLERYSWLYDELISNIHSGWVWSNFSQILSLTPRLVWEHFFPPKTKLTGCITFKTMTWKFIVLMEKSSFCKAVTDKITIKSQTLWKLWTVCCIKPSLLWGGLWGLQLLYINLKIVNFSDNWPCYRLMLFGNEVFDFRHTIVIRICQPGN